MKRWRLFRKYGYHPDIGMHKSKILIADDWWRLGAGFSTLRDVAADQIRAQLLVDQFHPKETEDFKHRAIADMIMRNWTTAGLDMKAVDFGDILKDARELVELDKPMARRILEEGKRRSEEWRRKCGAQ